MFKIFKNRRYKVEKINEIMKTLLQWRKEHQEYNKKNKKEKSDTEKEFVFIIERNDRWEA